MGLRGRLETFFYLLTKGVDADGNPVRYQWGAYDGAQDEWVINFTKLGGTAEAMAFVPFDRGRGFFCCLLSPKIIRNIEERSINPSVDEVE